MRLFGKFRLKNKYKNQRSNSVIRYIHPLKINDIHESVDNIVEQLTAAIAIAKKMKAGSCETETFKMYKKMFHDAWLGIAEHYNAINAVDIEKYSDDRYIP